MYQKPEKTVCSPQEEEILLGTTDYILSGETEEPLLFHTGLGEDEAGAVIQSSARCSLGESLP